MKTKQPNKQPRPKILLVLLFIAVIICSLVIQSGLLMEKTVLNTDYYDTLLEDPELHEFIWSSLWQELAGKESLPASDSAVFQAFRKSFDEQWIKGQLGMAVGEALDFVKGNIETLTISLDIGVQKETFRQELLSLAGQPDDSKLADSLKDFLREEVVPEQYLLLAIDSPADLDPEVFQGLTALQTARAWFRYASYVTYGLLLLLALILGGLSSGLKWYGGGIITAGIIFAVVNTCLGKDALVQPFLEKFAPLGILSIDSLDLTGKVIASMQDTLVSSIYLQMVAGVLFVGAGFMVTGIAKRFEGVS